MSSLRDRLAKLPEPHLSESLEDELQDSVRYLGSDEAQRSLDADTYWPKWNSPWWHMVLLFELGEARRIPARAATKMVEGLAALPVKIFPIRPDEAPGADPYRDMSCHCALGSMYQVLTACGVDVNRALPWAEPWFARYQMADGGLNCDASAYLQTDEVASSMVGTVAPLEAMLLGDARAWSAERRGFVERAGGFLAGRELRLGSASRHNAEERDAAKEWSKLCFPRFYFYDVLRGLTALIRYSDLTNVTIQANAVEVVLNDLIERFPDGVVHLGRQSFAGAHTIVRRATGEWIRDQEASRFALLDAVSAVGRVSPSLTRAWSEARRELLRLSEAGRLA